MKKQSLLFTILNIAGFVATVIINWLANSLPLNGQRTGDVSDAYPNLFVPANITFAIWGVIYALLTAFIIYNIVASRKEGAENAFIGEIGPWFFVASIINVFWIIAWHWNLIFLTLILMLLLLACLIKIYLTLKGGSSSVRVRRYLVELPFSVYLGWITVATIANLTAFLVSLNWNGFGIAESFWAGLVIITAVIITVFMILRQKDYAYALVVIWALFGIWLKRSNAVSTVPDLAVEVVAMGGLLLLVLVIVLQVLRGRAYHK